MRYDQPDHEGTRVYTHDLTKERFYQKTPKPTRTTGIALSAVGTTTADEQATRPVGRTGKLRAATSEVSPPLPPRAAPPPPSTEDEQVTGLAVGAIGELTPILPDNWRNRPSVRRHERDQRRRRRRRQRKPPPAAALINNSETPPVTTRAPTSTRAPTRPRRRWDGWEWIYDNDHDLDVPSRTRLTPPDAAATAARRVAAAAVANVLRAARPAHYNLRPLAHRTGR